MLYGPSHELHCDPCLFQKVPEADIPVQAQLLEMQEVKLFAGRLAAKQDLGLPPTESTPPIAYLRHQAAISCATTILRGDCPLFVYAKNAKGHKTISNRVEGFTGLKSIK